MFSLSTIFLFVCIKRFDQRTPPNLDQDLEQETLCNGKEFFCSGSHYILKNIFFSLKTKWKCTWHFQSAVWFRLDNFCTNFLLQSMCFFVVVVVFCCCFFDEWTEDRPYTEHHVQTDLTTTNFHKLVDGTQALKSNRKWCKNTEYKMWTSNESVGQKVPANDFPQ